jgi:hypothetical protein
MLMRKSSRLKSLKGKQFLVARLGKPLSLVTVVKTFKDDPKFVVAQGVFRMSELKPSPFGKR